MLRTRTFLALVLVAFLCIGCLQDEPPLDLPTQIPLPDDLADKKPAILKGHLEIMVERTTQKVARRPFGIALSPDGERIYVAAALMGEVSVVSVNDMEVMEKWGPFGEHLFSVIPSNDGTRLFGFGLGGQHLFVIDTHTGRLETKLFLGRNISDVILGPDETVLVGSTADQKVSIVDQKTLEIKGEVLFSHPIGYLAVGEKGTIACATGGVYTLASGSSRAVGGPVSFFDPTKEGEAKIANVLQVGTHTRKPVFVENDNYLLVPDRLEGTVRVFNVMKNTLEMIIDVGGGPEKIIVHPTQHEVYSINTLGRSVTVIGLRPLRLIQQIELPANPEDGILSRDGTQLYLTLPANAKVKNRIAVIALRERRVLDLIPTGRDPCRMALSADGNTLFVTNFLANSLSILK